MTVEDSKLLSVVGKAQSLEDSLSTIHSLDAHRSNGKPFLSIYVSISLSLYLTLSLSLYLTLSLSHSHFISLSQSLSLILALTILEPEILGNRNINFN